MCRCGTCGRFTSHWADDESFCSNETCWKEDEFGYISPPKALLCENCKEAMTSDNDFFSEVIQWLNEHMWNWKKKTVV